MLADNKDFKEISEASALVAISEFWASIYSSLPDLSCETKAAIYQQAKKSAMREVTSFRVGEIRAATRT